MKYVVVLSIEVEGEGAGVAYIAARDMLRSHGSNWIPQSRIEVVRIGSDKVDAQARLVRVLTRLEEEAATTE